MSERQRSEQEWDAIREELYSAEGGEGFMVEFVPIHDSDGFELEIIDLDEMIIDTSTYPGIRYPVVEEPEFE